MYACACACVVFVRCDSGAMQVYNWIRYGSTPREVLSPPRLFLDRSLLPRHYWWVNVCTLWLGKAPHTPASE